MAKRRMLSLDIMRSDEFLELSAESQLLYLHLFIEADDDGFINGKKRIASMLGLKSPAFDALADAGFILTFPSGAAVITHWKLCNKVPSDRYVPTKHVEEMRSLEYVPNVGYVFKTANNAEEPSESAEDDPSPAAPAAAEGEHPDGAPLGENGFPGLPLNDGTEHFVAQSRVKELKELYPAVDVIQELRNMRGWLLANPARKKTASGVERFINTWLSNAQNAPRDGPGYAYYGAVRKNEAPKRPPSYDLELAEHIMKTTVPELKKRKR